MITKKDLMLRKLSGDFLITEIYSSDSICNSCGRYISPMEKYICLYNESVDSADRHYHVCMRCWIIVNV